MAFLNIEDTTGGMECLVFPRTLADNGKLFEVGGIVVLTGRVSLREDEEPKLVCESVQTPEEALKLMTSPQVKPEPPKPKAGTHGKPGLYLKGIFKGRPTHEKGEKSVAGV